MAVLNPRYRIVTFRLSSNEYEHVYAAAEMDAARSLSDFARSAVLARAGISRDFLSEREQLRVLAAKTEEIMRLLAELDRRLGAAAEQAAEAPEEAVQCTQSSGATAG